MNDAPHLTEMLGAHSIPQRVGRSPQVETSDVGERVVLYHRGSGKSLVLNPSGALLWRSLKSPLSATELVARLRQHFPTLDEATAQRDVTAFLRALTEHDSLLATE